MGLPSPSANEYPEYRRLARLLGNPRPAWASKGYVAAWDTTGVGAISGIDEIWPGLSENSDVTEEMITT